MKISIVIPAYNSNDFIEKIVEIIHEELSEINYDLEIVIVNDNSTDNVWEKIKILSDKYETVKGINMARNYGQHIANIVGFRHCTGDFVVTMDDDLQNPPGEIRKLIKEWEAGYDLVVGVFETKQHELWRRVGSRLMQTINRRVFNSPRGFRHTNFRLIDKSVVDRINTYQSRYPYTSGLAMLYANRPRNVLVAHNRRIAGTSGYNMRKLIKLAWNIVFNYSRLPIRLLLLIGFIFSISSAAYAAYLIVFAIAGGSSVPGWTSLAFMIAISNALIMIVLTLIGEYLAIVIEQIRAGQTFHIKEKIGITDDG